MRSTAFRWLSVALIVGCAISLGPVGPAAAGPATGTISGRFVTAAGDPVGSVPVRADGTDLSAVPATAHTGPDGRYSLVVPAGSYRLSFVRADHPVQWARQKASWWAADVVEVVAGGTVTVDGTALPSGAITGLVTDHAGAPAAHHEVYVLDENNSVVDYGRTGVDGRYSLRLVAGRYRLGFGLPGDASARRQYAPQRVQTSEGTLFEVLADRTLTVDERLLRLGTLSGQLLTAAGQPLVGATVTINHRAFGDSAGSTTTGADGRYRITALPGTYTVSFHVPATSRLQYLFGAKTWAAATPIAVVGGAVTEASDRLLPTGDLRILGRDTRTGAPVGGFCVGADSAFGCSDGTGEVRLTGVAQGPTTLYHYNGDGTYFSGETTVQARGGTSTDVVLGLRPAAVVTAVVRDAVTGQPVPGACVTDLPLGAARTSGESFNECSDAEGRVRIGERESGDTTLFVRPATGSPYGAQWVGRNGGTGDQRAARTVTLAVGTQTAVPDIRLDRAGNVTGRITAAGTGAPVAHAQVSLTTWHPGPSGSSGLNVEADADGRYTFRGLGPYPWPLLFAARDLPHQWSGGTADRHAAHRVPVSAGGSTRYDMAMVQGATLTVAAPNAAGWILATNTATGDAMAIAAPSGDGRYTMRVLGPQTIYLSADNGQRSRPVAVPVTGTRAVDLVPRGRPGGVRTCRPTAADCPG